MPPKDLAGKDLSHANLDGVDLAGADLRDASLRDAYARDADLSDADMTGADLTGADLRGSRLDGATVDESALDKADLRDVDLTGLNVTPEASSGQAAENNGPTRSTIEGVVAIKVEGEPCCVEILVAAADCGAPTQHELPHLRPMPSDHALVTLDLHTAKDLVARLNRAISVLEDRDTPNRSG
jgi:uncharacterized protein YjbI with pentapeptide repeats